MIHGDRAYVVLQQTIRNNNLYTTTTDAAIIDITSGDVLTDESFSEEGKASNASLDFKDNGLAYLTDSRIEVDGNGQPAGAHTTLYAFDISTAAPLEIP